MKTILIIVAVYYGFKFISRYLLPLFLKYIVGKATDKFTDGFNQQNQQEQKPEGEVSIDKTVNNKSKIKTC